MAATIPESTKLSLHQRLADHALNRWGGLAEVKVRFRGRFAYVDGELHTGEVLPLRQLRYTSSAVGFAIYFASRDGYQDSVLPSGLPVGSPEEALDCACGLHLNDPSARQERLSPANPDHARTSIHRH